MAEGASIASGPAQVGGQDVTAGFHARPRLSASGRLRTKTCPSSFGLEMRVHRFAQKYKLPWEKLTPDLGGADRGVALHRILRAIPVRLPEIGLASDGRLEPLGQTFPEAVAEQIERMGLDVDDAGIFFCVRALVARDEAVRVIVAALPPESIRVARWNVDARRMALAVPGSDEQYTGLPDVALEFRLTSGAAVVLILDFKSGWAATQSDPRYHGQVAGLIALRAAELRREGVAVVAAYSGVLTPQSTRTGRGSGINLRSYDRNRIDQLVVDVQAEAVRAVHMAALIAREETEGSGEEVPAYQREARPGLHCVSCTGKAACNALQQRLLANAKDVQPFAAAVAEASKAMRSKGEKFPHAEDIEAIAIATLKAAGLQSDAQGNMDPSDIARTILRLKEMRPLANLTEMALGQLDTIANELIAQGHDLPGIGTEKGNRQTTIELSESDTRSELRAVYDALSPLRAKGTTPPEDPFEHFCRIIGKVQIGSLVHYLQKIGVGKNKIEREGLLRELPKSPLRFGHHAPSIVVSTAALAEGIPAHMEAPPVARARKKPATSVAVATP